jgi:hypothetical protein
MVFGMKRFAPLILLVSLGLVIFVPLAMAAATKTPAARAGAAPGASIATAISTVTGIAISPLLGTAGYGAYQWITATDDAAREKLPWYAQMKFWLPALLVVGICAAKDSFGAAVPPGLKKPLDVLETIENKFSGLIAAGAVVPVAIDAITKMFLESYAAAGPGFELVPSGLAMIQVGAIHWSWLLDILTVPLGIAVFVTVWLASHAINVLILLSPWGAIDAALKAARTGLLGLIVITATMNPWLSAALSLVVIVVSYFVAGWAFRLMVFGTIFCWEFVTLKRARFSPAENENVMFAGPNLPGVPIRTYGRLVRRADGALEFVYRPWLIREARVARLPVEPPALAVGQGVFFSDIVSDDGRTLFTLPPRFRGHEAALARVYALAGGVKPAGLRKAWSALRELLGGRAATAPALPQPA